ncbi:MAG: formyl transferase [Myxococcales bacterium]|nr:formyl transferase [Myxococcales bacterium]
MRLLFFGNNYSGWQALSWLVAEGVEVVGVVVHPEERARYRVEILEAADLPPECVFDGSRLRDPAVRAALAELRADAALSVYFGYLLPPELLDLLPRGAINLHPALLPYNRGANPNVWSLVDQTPAGVTLHYLDAGVDTGDIIAQDAVPIAPTDTGETLYRKLEQAGLDLLRRVWPLFESGRAPRRPQPAGGSVHRLHDLDRLDEIDPDATVRAGDLLNLLRARTFPPYRGAYLRAGGEKIYLRLQLLTEKEFEDGSDG